MRNLVLAGALALILVLGTTTGLFADVSMDDRITKSTSTLNEWGQMPETGIPGDIVKNCRGLVIMSGLKAGLVVGGRAFSGIVVAKNAETGMWSAPAAIDTGGASIGLQIGVEAIDLILILNTDAAVEAFSKGNFALGADVSVAAGPVGRTAEVGVAPKAAIYTYSRSKGAFAGISLE